MWNQRAQSYSEKGNNKKKSIFIKRAFLNPCFKTKYVIWGTSKYFFHFAELHGEANKKISRVFYQEKINKEYKIKFFAYLSGRFFTGDRLVRPQELVREPTANSLVTIKNITIYWTDRYLHSVGSTLGTKRWEEKLSILSK